MPKKLMRREHRMESNEITSISDRMIHPRCSEDIVTCLWRGAVTQSGFLGTTDCPLVNLLLQFANWKMAIEIVDLWKIVIFHGFLIDLPMKNGDFPPSFLCQRLQRVFRAAELGAVNFTKPCRDNAELKAHTSNTYKKWTHGCVLVSKAGKVLAKSASDLI